MANCAIQPQPNSDKRNQGKPFKPPHSSTRLEAEREVVALMDHPNIARVLDTGTTEQERPYFVMQ
jgi:serine/threonine protein kinase